MTWLEIQWDRIRFQLWFRWVQCAKPLEFYRMTAYCVRHKGHWGKCRTNDGLIF